jgi:hypothetical protein
VRACAAHINGSDGTVRLGLEADLASPSAPGANALFLATDGTVRASGSVSVAAFPRLLHFPACCIELASRLRRGDPVLRRRVLSLWVQSVGLRAAVSVGRGGALLARSEGLLAATTLQVNLRSRIVW